MDVILLRPTGQRVLMRTGLRTEIILSISLLLAAALLFAGFLLLKLTERNLLDQQRAHAADVMSLLLAGLDSPAISRRPADNPEAADSLKYLQTVLSEQTDILAWRLLDTRMQVVSSTAYQQTGPFTTLAPSVLEEGELFEELNYQSFRIFGDASARDYLDLSAPLWSGQETSGLLQVRFSLASLQERIGAAQQLVLVYVIVYGGILAAFGVYLLNRNVVKPVRQLHQATTRLAEGTLTSVKIPAGPGEIHELAESFNRMVDALAASRAETEEHIASLEKTNRALAQARDDLVRSEKLATVGHLAAGMAHEIGNPLGAVVGYLNILRDDLEGEARDLAERSLTETARIDRLVRELLEFSAPVDREPESFCAVSLLRETVAMLRHQGQLEAVTVEDRCQPETEICLVTMDRGRLMQVWINLLLNARDAMHDQGRITLTSRIEGPLQLVEVSDAGEGMSPEVLSRVFEPFFTTKAPGQGYGLGLAVCQRIIDESGGTISARSTPGEGASFLVKLPCHAESIS